MRLTLRTLLAYMDDILDPADQEELGRKIEASPFATELIHRSRDAVRRLRLSAPEVLAGESDDLHEGDENLDANTAAEYLDNTLPPDDVAAFERSCLEAGPHADMLLAETASCHHILTLVLGEPAEVDADLRQRMYAIAAHSVPAAATTAAAAALSAPPVQAVAAPVFNARPVVDLDEASVPDYMLEAARARRRKRNLWVMLFVAAMLGGVATVLFWPSGPAPIPKEVASGEMGDLDEVTSGVDVGEPETTDAGGAASTGDIAAANAGAADSEAPAFVPSASAPPAGEAEAAGDDLAGDEASGAAADETDDTTPDAGSLVGEAPELDLELPAVGELGGEVGIPSTTDVPPVVTDDAGGGEGEPAIDVADAGAMVDPADVITPPATGIVPPASPVDPGTGDLGDGTVPAVPGGEELASASPMVPPTTLPGDLLPGETGDASPVVSSDPPAETAVAAAASAANEAPQQLASYLGVTNDLLLEFDESAGAWIRVPPRSTFTAGARLLAPPAFRTLVVVGPDINMFISGGTEVTLLSGTDYGADVGLAVPYGRVIINSGLNGNRIALVMGDVTRVLELQSSSSLAVEVRRKFVPGNDPAQAPAPLEVRWYLTSGSLTSTGVPAEAAGEALTAAAPATWTTVDAQETAPQAIDDLPDWVNKEPLSSTEASARDDIGETFVVGEAFTIPLQELSSGTGLGRRTEVRTLAGRTAAFVGEFEPLVKALADTAERAKRKQQVTALRDAIARNPESVEQIREAFVLQRGEAAADDLMEMLLGFNSEMIGGTRQEVQDGSLLRLISWLDNDELMYRVLAAHNVNEITGTTGLGGYRPEHAADARRRELKFYWDRLDSGELMPTEWTPTGWAER